ncbi:cytochrome b/b6 domain-containing protein [Lentisalinibacter sediminis]|uniref:cytochrome b/b6 domain-containing protein n=1 Tax=Lentisalinibacter sediminis TaxID=2992237 RepID=UPI00386F6751
MTRPASVVIWDPLVRVFHWTLAVIVVANYWLTESGEDIHTWLGYTAAAAVLARVVWGFLGTKHARFADFPVSLARIREHFRELAARKLPVDSGHNPLGAIMVYLMFLLVAVLACTGWLHEEVDALYGNELLQQVHAYAAHTLWIGALVHVAAVFVVQYTGRIELVRPMITGRRRLKP